jgi:hypothetical protein
MIYLLDSNVCVSHLRGKSSVDIEARLDAGEFNRVPGLRTDDWQTN